ncbi:primosomal protein N' [Nocardia stercoris]|uniref:primosomal protein N' n=1 Tax=Nocardia stercoris TaxID=2483361 RepID=UPI001F344446|nr:primosomal protein N' [Nocardia stercoris]
MARVLPLLEPAHLDRDFDYLVPPELDAIAQPGVRVRVRFSGRLVDGYLLERLERSDHTGRLMRLERVVSGEQVLTPEILRLVTAVAARYAGTRADVLRLAVPPRHAKVEGEAAKAAAEAVGSAASDVDSAVPQEVSETAVRNKAPSDGPRSAAGDGGDEDAVAAGVQSVATVHAGSGPVGGSDDQRTPEDDGLKGRAGRAASIPHGHPAVGVGDSGTLPGPAALEQSGVGTASAGRASDIPPDGRGSITASVNVPLAGPKSDSAVGGSEPVGGTQPVSRPEDVGEPEPVAGVGSVVPAAVTFRAGGEGPSGVGAAGVGDVADRANPVATQGVSRFAAWGRYRHGMSFLQSLGEGKGPRAAWQALPGEDWARRLAELAAVVVGGGRSAVLMVPDQRDLDRVLAACTEMVGEAAVGLSAGLGPAARYRRWLSVLRGTAQVVVGTRSAVFAPARDLGLIVIWDDGDDTYAEPRSPYPHGREVAMLRAHETGAAFVVGGFARTAEAQAIVESGWAHDLVADRAEVRACAPRISAPGDTDIALERDPVARAVRIPGVAFAAARRALAAGEPVLVQVPRRGYVPALSCAKCRTPARCRHCNGPLALPDNSSGVTHGPDRGWSQLPGGSRDQESRPRASARELGVALSRSGSGEVAHSPACRWCGKVEAAFRCPACGSRALRAVVIGAARTAEELGRAFPGVPIRGSGGKAVLDSVPEGAQVVVSTIGAEPVVPGGYGVGLLLDGWALLGRADLRAAEDTLRRWMTAATLVRPSGQVIVMAEPSLPTVQALVRWDPVGHAAFELAARAEVCFPPTVRLAALDGTADSVAELLAEAQLPPGTEILGPVPLPPGARKPFSAGESPAEVERMILRTDRAHGPALSRALTAALAVRSTRKQDAPLRVQIDPLEIG